MPRFPVYGPHFQYYRPYNYNYSPHTPPSKPSHPNNSPLKETSKIEISPPQNSKSLLPVWFDLFGIKLYFDDVLILSLLFFLYKEEAKDESLFLALVLLLIS